MNDEVLQRLSVIETKLEASTPPLSDEEITYFREMKKREEHVRWLWASVRIWGGWVAASCAATWAIVKWLEDVGFIRKIGI